MTPIKIVNILLNTNNFESDRLLNKYLFTISLVRIVVETNKASGEKCPICWKIKNSPCERPHCK